jgi:hypothetical protein
VFFQVDDMENEMNCARGIYDIIDEFQILCTAEERARFLVVYTFIYLLFINCIFLMLWLFGMIKLLQKVS